MSVAADGSTEANLYFVPRGQNANESRHTMRMINLNDLCDWAGAALVSVQLISPTSMEVGLYAFVYFAKFRVFRILPVSVTTARTQPV